MRIELRDRREPDAETLGVALILVAFPSLAIWLLGFGQGLPGSRVPEWLGVPCVLCGGTRSLTYLLSGDVTAAFAMNPLVAAGALAFVGWAVYAGAAVLLSLRRVRVVLEGLFELRVAVVVAGLILLANWLYLWAMGI